MGFGGGGSKQSATQTQESRVTFNEPFINAFEARFGGLLGSQTQRDRKSVV